MSLLHALNCREMRKVSPHDGTAHCNYTNHISVSVLNYIENHKNIYRRTLHKSTSTARGPSSQLWEALDDFTLPHTW